MKRLLLLVAVLIVWPALVIARNAPESVPGQYTIWKEGPRTFLPPTQRKWISTKLIGGDEKAFHVIILLYPEQACSMISPREDKTQCYWHWQFLPDTPRDIRDDEAIVRLGSYFAWVTEQEYCDMVKGTHQMSSPKLDAICRESWMEFFQLRDDIPDALKIIVYPF